MSPSGQFKDLILSWKESGQKFPDLILKAQLLNVGINPYKDFPGIKNLTGLVDIKKRSGTVKSVSKNLTIIKKDTLKLKAKLNNQQLFYFNDLFNLKNIVIQNNDINSIVNGSYKYIAIKIVLLT